MAAAGEVRPAKTDKSLLRAFKKSGLRRPGGRHRGPGGRRWVCGFQVARRFRLRCSRGGSAVRCPVPGVPGGGWGWGRVPPEVRRAAVATRRPDGVPEVAGNTDGVRMPGHGDCGTDAHGGFLPCAFRAGLMRERSGLVGGEERRGGLRSRGRVPRSGWPGERRTPRSDGVARVTSAVRWRN